MSTEAPKITCESDWATLLEATRRSLEDAKDGLLPKRVHKLANAFSAVIDCWEHEEPTKAKRWMCAILKKTRFFYWNAPTNVPVVSVKQKFRSKHQSKIYRALAAVDNEGIGKGWFKHHGVPPSAIKYDLRKGIIVESHGLFRFADGVWIKYREQINEQSAMDHYSGLFTLSRVELGPE